MIKRSDIIFERVNIQKLIFVMMMIISTLLIMNYGIPAIFSNNQSSGINEKNIDILLNGSIGWLPVLLFKFSLVVLGPVIEEIYFRGIMFEEAQTLGKFVQIVWPTVIFSAIHFPLTLEQWVTYSVAGGMLMLVRVLTKRLQYSIIFHILHNFIVLVS
ncbi:lysostaphin resistance A-like protein [Leuconostoc sp. MS02]|uniref:Lysostaphin resistance A-like protein n=1 Tax=Leuconostoc aquikimchii TaxID=3236804 RepID=A0ABV3S0H6_9LACO